MRTEAMGLDAVVVELDVECLLALASQHGEDEGLDLEIADLEMLARRCWAHMSVEQRLAALQGQWVSQAVELELMPRKPRASANGIEWFIRSAELHGQGDDPDHQAGDLQDAVRGLWASMSIGGRRAVLRDASVSDMVETAGGLDGLLGADDEGPWAPLDDEWESVLERFGLDVSFCYTPQQVAVC